MSQQVLVDRDLEFRGAAKYQPNVKGPLMTELKIFDETFMADAAQQDWNEQETGCTIAHAAVDGGAETITGDNTAVDDLGELSHTAQWSAAYNCGVEFKIKVSQITDICVCAGFVDAKEATNDHVAGELNSAAALRDPTVTADAALFVFDRDCATTAWYVAAINNNSIGTPVVAVGSVAPVANTYFKVRIQTDSDGNCTFYYGAGNSNNLTAVGYLPTAIAYATTNLLTPYVGFLCRVKGTQLATISRITTWQDN